MKKILVLTITISIIVSSCSKHKDDCRYVRITTEYGNIVLKLYNETPKHRDNFIKLSDAKFYDGQIFHRVINNFVIQGGDPSTKNALPDSLYGEKDSGYLIDAEFIDSLIHKKGALGMAREGDDINPEKKSSGSQFYIVKGKILTNEQLDELEKKRNIQIKSKLYKELLNEKFLKHKSQFNKIDTLTVSLEVGSEIDSIWENYPKFKFSQRQRTIYTKIGGIPHLDGNYTVFGEVIEGLDVVDKISSLNTDKNDRPLKDTKFDVIVLK